MIWKYVVWSETGSCTNWVVIFSWHLFCTKTSSYIHVCSTARLLNSFLGFSNKWFSSVKSLFVYTFLHKEGGEISSKPGLRSSSVVNPCWRPDNNKVQDPKTVCWSNSFCFISQFLSFGALQSTMSSIELLKQRVQESCLMHHCLSVLHNWQIFSGYCSLYSLLSSTYKLMFTHRILGTESIISVLES